MSKQFSLYLLPADIEHVLDELRREFSLEVLQAHSRTLRPVILKSPLDPCPPDAKITQVCCYLAPTEGREIKLTYVVQRAEWHIDMSSEVIEFSGCDFDELTLRIGRFYFQTDFLLRGAIWKKRSEFLNWGDRIFRATKKLLKWSPRLDAYVGPAAEEWRKRGGQFNDFFGRADNRPLD